MQVGLLVNCENASLDRRDEDVYQLELSFAVAAEELGFDTLWATEHHFAHFTIPDNFVLLSYLAARTSRVRLGIGAAILPWNEPARVAERAVMLDMLSGGRMLLGFGRGSSRVEYGGLAVPMDESRSRFEEAAAMVLRALETGTVSGPGPHFPRPERPLRPRPERPLKGRLYAVGISPESVKVAARVGGGLIAFVQKGLEKHAEDIEVHRDEYRALHGEDPPIPVLSIQTYCHPDPDVAEEVARRHMAEFMLVQIRHYEMAGEHFGSIRGYENYDEGARMIREAGLEAFCEESVNSQLWGTPDQILEKVRWMRSIMGDFEVVMIPRFGDIADDVARASFDLFATEVVPEIHRM